MAYDNAAYKITAGESRLLKHFHDDATGSEYLVVAWTGLERDYFEEYKAFLQTFTWPSNFENDPNTPVRLVDNPEIGPELSRYEGAWLRSSVTTSDDDSSELILTLVRVYNSVKDSAGVYSRAVLLNKEQFRASEANLILQFRNIDPRAMDTLVKAEFSSDDYTNVETGNDTYSGSWKCVGSPSLTDESGAGVITWYLTKHNNDDVVYRYYANAKTIVTDFFKFRMLESGWADLRDNYYWADDGLYYSADGVNYTKLDGVAVDPAVALPADAKRLNQSVAGRTVELSENRREDDRTTDLFAKIIHNVDGDESGNVYRGGFGETMLDLELADVSETRRDDFVNHTYFDAAGKWYYSADGVDYTKLNGATVYPAVALPAGVFQLDSADQEGVRLLWRTAQDKATQRWSIQLTCSSQASDVRCSYLGSSDTRLTIKPNGLASITFDQAYNVTHSELTQAMTYYNTTPAAGIVRRINPPTRNPETGLYNYEAMEVSSNPVVAVFRVGPETLYLGFNHTKYPTTDLTLFNADTGKSTDADDPTSDNFYLVGGKYSGGVWSTVIDSTSNVLPNIDLNEENNTWNWRIRHITPVAEVIGEPDPSSSTGNFIFEYGDALDFMRYVGRYTAQEIVLGDISLLSRFENVPANAFGTHAALVNRRKVTPIIKNERMVDGVLSFDVYEQVRTPYINDDDAWYLHGCNEALDRNLRNISSEILDYQGFKLAVNNTNHTVFTHLMKYADGTIDNTDDVLADNVIDTGDVLNGKTPTHTDIPVIAALQAATKRRKTVIRERKYFARKPTTADLTNTMDSGTTSIKSAMDAVANEATGGTEPSALNAKTYDIIKVAADLWAVERMQVKADDEFYRDDDAFDHLADSDGKSVLGVQVQLVHMQDTDTGGVTIDPTVVDVDKLHLRA